VFVVSCVGSGPCDELITGIEESYRECVSNFVFSEFSKLGFGHILFINIFC
jgi:hypothetical protein